MVEWFSRTLQHDLSKGFMCNVHISVDAAAVRAVDVVGARGLCVTIYFSLSHGDRTI